MLHELGSSWFFGWGHGVVQGLSEGDLFEELPRRWKSGVIHPVGPDIRSKVQDYKAMYEALYQLQKLQDEVNEREIVYSECLFVYVYYDFSNPVRPRAFLFFIYSLFFSFSIEEATKENEKNALRVIFPTGFFTSREQVGIACGLELRLNCTRRDRKLNRPRLSKSDCLVNCFR